MAILTWREHNGFIGKMEGENVDEAIEIGRLIYEADDDIEYVSISENGKVVKEWVW